MSQKSEYRMTLADGIRLTLILIILLTSESLVEWICDLLGI